MDEKFDKYQRASGEADEFWDASTTLRRAVDLVEDRQTTPWNDESSLQPLLVDLGDTDFEELYAVGTHCADNTLFSARVDGVSDLLTLLRGAYVKGIVIGAAAHHLVEEESHE